MRELGRRCGVSQAQISRIEAGAVEQPEVATLVSIARALSRDPRPLLVAAGHLRGERAREALRDLLTPHASVAFRAKAGEFEFDWKQAEALLAGSPADDELADLAVSMFVTSASMYDVLGAPWLDQLFGGNVDDDLQELILGWKALTDARQRKVLEYVRDQAALATAERVGHPNT